MKITKINRSLPIIILFIISACGQVATKPSQPTPTVAVKTPTAIIASSTPEPTVDPSIPVSGGALVIGTSQNIENILPGLVTEGLVMTDAEGGYEPVLAESMPIVSQDGLAVTYKLREGKNFQMAASSIVRMFNSRGTRFSPTRQPPPKWTMTASPAWIVLTRIPPC